MRYQIRLNFENETSIRSDVKRNAENLKIDIYHIVSR